MKYAVKKTLTVILTLLAVSFLVFLAFSVIPGDPVTNMLGTQATPERVEALREEMGLNAPLLLRYGRWLAGLVHGDFGTSYSYRMPVTQLIGDKLPVTVTLTLLAFAMMLAMAVPFGIYTARRAGGRLDRFFLILNQIIMAVPPFFSGILITLLFGLTLHWFMPGGYVSYTKNVGGFVYYLLFPAFAIALPKAAMTVKLLRSSILKEVKLDYVRTAYSRGNRTRDVFYRHVLKNAMVPVITFLGMALADIIAGSIIIEQVFSIPGLGRILLTSISNRDYPVVQAVIVCLAFFIIIVNYIVDLICRKVDPRIEQE